MSIRVMQGGIMIKQTKTAITPTRETDYPEWYQQVIKAADLAESSEIRGCMVIKPWGYSIWENIQKNLDKMFKDTGHKNAYFPLFIPKSYFEKEAEHVKGFAKECAVVTHSRLVEDEKGGLKLSGELAEPLIVRPTSETIIGSSFSKWIQSYRDLPLLINQWCNIVRWEMRTRMFLRTTEFLWQEGHTAHATKPEALEETLKMLDVYANFVEEFLAIPVLKGEKTVQERFPGALKTFCIEVMMGDKKSLQAGTSHFLGQNFAKASNIKFQNQQGIEEYAWTTSWGVSTRLIGALIMAHSDDNGLVLPPKIAPEQVVIIPIYKNLEDEKAVMEYINILLKDISSIRYNQESIRVFVDNRDLTSSEKSWHWIKKGVPIRIEIGPKDMQSNSVFVAKRNFEPNIKYSQTRENFLSTLENDLDNIHKDLFTKALKYREENTPKIDNFTDFTNYFTPKNKEKPEIHGGFAMSHWCESADCENKLKDDLKVSIRCIPFDSLEDDGKCILCNSPSKRRVVFGKSY